MRHGIAMRRSVRPRRGERAAIRVLVASAAVIACLSIDTARLRADDEPPPEYSMLADRALSESAAGRWIEARALFQHAHELYPNARSARALGMACYELRDYACAYRELASSLAETRRPLDEVQIAQVQALLGELIAFVGRYTLDELPGDTTYAVDGVALAPSTDGMLILPLGRHDVEAIWSNGSDAATWNVAGGELEPLPLQTGPIVLRGPDGRQVSRPTSSRQSQTGFVRRRSAPSIETAPAESDDPRARDPRGATVTLLTGGAVLAVIGTTFIALGIQDQRSVTGAAMGTEWSTIADSYDRAPRRIAIGASILGLGLASIGVGLYISLRSRRTSDAVHAGLAPSNFHLRVSW